MIKAPLFSIILPVLHEADTINDLIDQIRAVDPDGTAEIIAVDGDPTGSTIHAIKDTGVIGVLAAQGRACQMNRGSVLASGEILVFLHADTLLPSDALTHIREAMRKERCVAGAFDLGLNTNRRIFRITEKYVYFRTRVTRIPFGDQAIFVRRDYFEKIGRYKEIPLMEDIEFMMRIKKQGDRICIIPLRVLTSVRRWEQEGILYCTIRNWTLQILYALGIPPEQLVKWYKS
jgi:rSAM/selenodomain-associated transferase 2